MCGYLERIDIQDDHNSFSNKQFCLFREKFCLSWVHRDHSDERLLSRFGTILQTEWGYHFTITNLFECKNLHVVLISGKVATRLLGHKQKHVSKFSKWTMKCV